MRVLIIIFMVFLPVIAYAQEKPVKSIQAGLGLAHSSLQDRVFSPLVFRGTGFSYDLHFRDEKTSRKHAVMLNIFMQQLNPTQHPLSLTLIQHTVVSLDYTFTKPVRNKNWNYYLGGGLYTLFAGRTIGFIVEDEAALDLFSSLNIVGSMARTFEHNHHVSAVLSYPLLSYVAGRMRVPLDLPQEVFRAIADNPDNVPVGGILRSGDVLSIMDFIDLRTRVVYEYQLSKHWRLGFMYRFRYYQYPKFLDVKHGSSRYSGIITFVF